MLASAEDVTQNMAHEEYGVTSVPYSFGSSSVIPLSADLGSAPQINYREFGDKPKEKH